MPRHHLVYWWFWIDTRYKPGRIYITDDFGNLVQMRHGHSTRLLED